MIYCCDELHDFHKTSHLLRHYGDKWYLWTQERNYEITNCMFCGRDLND